jgi:general nucleoside transport system ATP-binding protein
MAPALELRGIHKRFGPIEALSGVDFTLEPGEIHALLGENGAGKSTLMKIAFGLLKPDAGAVAIGGTELRPGDPREARRLGVGMVHQHFTSIPAFTVAENVALTAGWRLSPRDLAERVRDLAAATGLPIDPMLRVADLSAALKQRLEILKALAADARVLLLDEPTSVLSPLDADAFLNRVRDFRARGVATVLITHKLREALAIADRVTVLRRGRKVHCGPVGNETPERLARHMLGESVSGGDGRPYRLAPRAGGGVRVQAEGLGVERLGGSGTGLRSATLQVRGGELVGLAAVEGNGQRELLRAIAGLAKPNSGRLEVAGPVGFIPEDRTSEALVGEFTLTENLVLSQGKSAGWIHGPWVEWARAAARATELIASYGVRTSGPAATAGSLSGGNQQRLVIAETLEKHPAVLLAENPTRGLDFRAAAEVMERLRAAAEAGVAVLVHVSDLDELLAIADRIVVLAGGVVSEPPPSADREEIGRRMLGAGAG